MLRGMSKNKSKNKLNWVLGFALAVLPLQSAVSNVTAPGGDDSEVIVSRLKESMNSYGLISVEQHTGHLLFNPIVEKMHAMVLKKKFLMPAMIVNQSPGLKIVSEIPFSCFLISGGDLSGENYKGFRQNETARYIRDVKGTPVSRALICQAVGLAAARSWAQHLQLHIEEPFVFEDHVSVSGERFYYFLNNDGIFEMYF